MRVPLRVTDAGYFVDGKVGTKPVRFYLDTGSSGTIWPASLRLQGRETGETGVVLYGSDATARHKLVILPEISVGPFRYLDAPTGAVEPLAGGAARADADDTSAINAAGARVPILGMGTLQATPFTIDLRRKELVLRGPGGPSYRFAPHVRQGPVPVVEATVAGVKANLMIDSGVSGKQSRALLLSPRFARRLPIKPTARASFNSGPEHVRRAAAFPEVAWSIGPVRGSAPAVVLPDPLPSPTEGGPGTWSGPFETDGLIGSELLERARVTIDARAGTATLEPYDARVRPRTVPLLIRADHLGD